MPLCTRWLAGVALNPPENGVVLDSCAVTSALLRARLHLVDFGPPACTDVGFDLDLGLFAFVRAPRLPLSLPPEEIREPIIIHAFFIIIIVVHGNDDGIMFKKVLF